MNIYVASFLFLSGIAYLLYSWVAEQKRRYRHMEALLVFLRRTAYAMETEKIHIISYLEHYSCEDGLLYLCLQDMAKRLKSNCYPKGELVWQEVMKEKRLAWGVKDELYEALLGVGQGLFGRSRNENIAFLQHSINRVEYLLQKLKAGDEKERKVFIPVGMLGGLMVLIILV